MIKYIKSSKKEKRTVENTVTEIITTFDEAGGEIKVSGGKKNKYPLTDKPFINSLKTIYADLQRVMNHERNRRGDTSGLAFSKVEKEYQGLYWNEFNKL